MLGVLVFMFPFLGWRISSPFPNCGFLYYLINIAFAIVGSSALILCMLQRATSIDREMNLTTYTDMLKDTMIEIQDNRG